MTLNVVKSYFLLRTKVILSYRMTAFSGFVTQIIFALFKIFIMYAFIASNPADSPMTLGATITYIWITQIFFSIIPWNVNWDEMNAITSGNIVYELTKPIDLFPLFFSKTLAWRFGSSIVRVVPIVLFNLIVLPVFGFQEYALKIPDGKYVLFFLCSIFLAYILSSMITVFLYSITLYTIDASNFLGIINSVAFVLSGTIIPLGFFPEIFQKILILQPFKGIVDTPAMIFTQQYTDLQSLGYMLLQVAWIVIFYFVNQRIFKIGMKKIEIQGG
ncbi:hypothetical protein HB847_08035 [Listeria booriae]|uniref:ABC transporter permease n=1 Tax=Listeria booriae TaxID=1552123 RepID=A0A841XYM7_9LIST|nr:hypothetical protein [Listeria booriae]MBC1372321.1 hypothetical protein [Listeria booriae]